MTYKGSNWTRGELGKGPPAPSSITVECAEPTCKAATTADKLPGNWQATNDPDEAILCPACKTRVPDTERTPSALYSRFTSHFLKNYPRSRNSETSDTRARTATAGQLVENPTRREKPREWTIRRYSRFVEKRIAASSSGAVRSGVFGRRRRSTPMHNASTPIATAKSIDRARNHRLVPVVPTAGKSRGNEQTARRRSGNTVRSHDSHGSEGSTPDAPPRVSLSILSLSEPWESWEREGSTPLSSVDYLVPTALSPRGNSGNEVVAHV